MSKNEEKDDCTQTDYYKSIRNAFVKRKKEIENCGYSIRYNFLQEYLRKYYRINCDAKTISQLFDAQVKSSIKPHLIVAMCNILGLDLYSVIQYPQCVDHDYGRNNIQLKDVFKRIRVSDDEPDLFDSDEGAVSFLTNEFYQGEYHCYYYTPIHINNSISSGKYQAEVNTIRQASLKIKRENGETMAYLTEKNTQSGVSFTFAGRVLRLKNVNKIYMLLTANNGNGFMWLLFDDLVIKKRSLYYKEIAMMTHSINVASKPIFEKMIITRNEINLNEKYNESLIRGILTFDNETILVPADRVEEICASYKELDSIFDTKETFYKISKYDIISNNRLKLNYNERAKALLDIMSKSCNPTQSVIDQDENMKNLFFDLQGGL